MVINMTFGRVALDRLMLDRGCVFALIGLVGAACPNTVHAAARVITTTDRKKVDKKAEKRPNMRLVRRRLLLGAPRLLVCLRGKSFGGQCLG